MARLSEMRDGLSIDQPLVKAPRPSPLDWERSSLRNIERSLDVLGCVLATFPRAKPDARRRPLSERE